MQEQLDFIQLQLWLLVSLFSLLILTNVICYLKRNESNKRDEPAFSLMWDKDQLEELIEKARTYLQQYPNHQSALYFGAKALIVKQQFGEAAGYLERLSRIEPSLRDGYQDMIDECKRHEIESF
jgi:cytochrome c-type biogenesis protein CcmH/NrfG